MRVCCVAKWIYTDSGTSYAGGLLRVARTPPRDVHTRGMAARTRAEVTRRCGCPVFNSRVMAEGACLLLRHAA